MVTIKNNVALTVVPAGHAAPPPKEAHDLTAHAVLPALAAYPTLHVATTELVEEVHVTVAALVIVVHALHAPLPTAPKNPALQLATTELLLEVQVTVAALVIVVQAVTT